MVELEDLKKIKKIYGEDLMHFCRKNFPTMLEYKGLLPEILVSTFAANSKDLMQDILKAKAETKFVDLINSKFDFKRNWIKLKEEKTPYELLKEVGYELHECTTEEEIQSYAKYYDPDEVLCTITKKNRLAKNFVFWAIKEGAEKLNRKKFRHPEREDEYSLSVLGIQFAKKNSHANVSIKSRYNHTVVNPDATLSNDLDKLAPGLTESFMNLLAERGVRFSTINQSKSIMPNYVPADDGKFYKSNLEISGTSFCPGNIIIKNGTVTKLEPEKQILIDQFILDKENKTLKNVDGNEVEDSFLDEFQDIERIDVKKDKDNKTRIISIKCKHRNEPAEITINANNEIIGYKNNELTEVSSSFLKHNIALQHLELPNLKTTGKYFLQRNTMLEELELPSLEEADDEFMKANKVMHTFKAPKLKRVKDRFLWGNHSLEEIYFPELEEVGCDFLRFDDCLGKYDLSKLRKIGDYFMGDNRALKKIELPNVEEIGLGFFYDNTSLEEIVLPKVKTIGNQFVWRNPYIEKVEFPSLEKMGDDFFRENKALTELIAPNLKIIGDRFLMENNLLRELRLPSLEMAGFAFLNYNTVLQTLDLPNLVDAQPYYFKMPQLTHINKLLVAELSKNVKITDTEFDMGKNIITKIREKFSKEKTREN